MKKEYSDIGQRLKILRGSLSQTEMGKLFDMPLRTYQSYEYGHRVPPSHALSNIARRFGTTVDWLLSGEGKTEGKESKDLKNGTETDYTYIPQVNGKISAGKGVVPDNVIELRVAFRKEWIARKGDAKDMVLIKVSGDSMDPTLLNGDLVLIDRGRKYFEPQGGIYAIALDDTIMIKRVQLVGDCVKVISDNKMYDPFEVKADQVKINGKVIWFARELER